MTDLDAALRSMLRERAGDVSAVPPAVREAARGQTVHVDGDGAVIELLDAPATRSRRRRGWGVLAAAAAVVVAAGVAVALRSGHPHAAPATRLRGCVVAPTPAWTQAIRAADVRIRYAGQLGVLGIDDRGRAVVSYVDPRGQQSSRFALFGPSQTAIHRSVALPQAPGGVQSQLTGGHWLLLDEAPTSTAGIWPGGLGRVVLLNLRSGRQVTVPTKQFGGEGGFVQDGQFYYQTVEKSAGSSTDVIMDFDIARRTQHVLLRASAGTSLDLAGNAAGIWWDSGVAMRNAGVPAPVAAAFLHRGVGMDTNRFNAGGQVVRSSFVTDGHSWAWQTASGTVDWWQPGSPVVRVTGLLGLWNPEGNERTIDAVAGPYVEYYQAAAHNGLREMLLDVRTGAATTLIANTDARSAPSIGDGENGLLLGSGPLPHFISSPLRSGTLIRLDTATLPRLSCPPTG